MQSRSDLEGSSMTDPARARKARLRAGCADPIPAPVGRVRNGGGDAVTSIACRQQSCRSVLLDGAARKRLSGRRRFPAHEAEGNNREHGADDPKRDQDRGCPRNCKRIAVHPRGASVPCHCATRGKADERRISASQETCRQASIQRHGRGSPEQEFVMTTIGALLCVFSLPFPRPADLSSDRTA